MRVSLGTDPISGASAYRSISVRGDLRDAERAREELAAQATQLRASQHPPLRTVAELLRCWIDADHRWKPATWQNYRQAVRRLTDDPLARRAPGTVTPPVLRAAARAWTSDGVPTSTISLHVRTLRAAFSWAFDQRLIASHPLAGARGPAQPEPRRDVPLEVVRELLAAADTDVAAVEQLAPGRRRERQLHTAEQIRLLLRLAADTGARRGELSALRTDDLHDRLLHIDRGVSAEIVTTTKTGRSRRVTLGAHTTELWHDTLDRWRHRLPPDQHLGPWLFSPDADHHRRLVSSTLGHWFTRFVRRHDHPDVCLHRLRHTVATVLVADGKLLQAQQRLGHAEASTTLRQYCHALPLHDEHVADRLDELLYADP